MSPSVSVRLLLTQSDQRLVELARATAVTAGVLVGGISSGESDSRSSGSKGSGSGAPEGR
jgi:hypothetical protein